MDGQDLALIASLVVAVAAIAAALNQRRQNLHLKRQNEILAEQNAILDRQVGGEQAERDAARRADVRLVRGGRDGLGYWFELINIGPAPATQVRGWVARAEDHDAPISPTTEVQGPLLPHQTSERLSVNVPEAMILERWPAVLLVDWRDSGDHARVFDSEINW